MPSPLPIPENFPIRWRQPEDEAGFWFQDLMHNPTPLTPLTQTFMLPAFSKGASAGIQHLSMPIVGLRCEAHNHYGYITAVPFMGTPEEMEARMQGMMQALGSIVPGLLAQFESEYVPRILEIVATLQKTDYEAMPLPELARHVVALHELAVELWDIHMKVNIPPMAAVFGFDEFLAQALGPESERRGHLMLQGFPNKSIESGHLLWELASEARKDAGLVSILLETPAAALPGALSATPAGRSFAARWEAFLQDYGWRTGAFEFADVPWVEDPTVALNHLRAFLSSPDSADPIESQRRQAEERDRLVAETEAALPPPMLPVFRQLLAGAQTYIPIAEDHNFYIDQMALSSFRVPFLALGRALTSAGVITAANDVFYLTLDDIAAIGAGDSSPRQAVVEVRRADLDHFRTIIPPEAIGTPPPADMPIDPLVTKFFGFGQEFPMDAKAVRGIASSGGTATGTVKVVRTLDQAGKLEPGDIMVCHMTMPAWTPLFATVGAVVADSGGVLSHCSIVAREYGIPCVTATRFGTRVLHDGQRVTVDGNRGIVVVEG